MTTISERAEKFAAVLDEARSDRPWRLGASVTTYWFAGDMLDEGSAWITANADILPYEVDASWRQMDNGPLLTLRARNCADVADALAAAYALSDRFGVGVTIHQPARMDVASVSVERISTSGYRANTLRIDFRAAVWTAVPA